MFVWLRELGSLTNTLGKEAIPGFIAGYDDKGVVLYPATSEITIWAVVKVL